MKHEFVTYELALRMKQLGFNEHCFGVYDDDDDNTFYEIRSSYSIGFSKNIEGRVLAPTWQSAFRWFREKYDLHYLRPTKYSETKWWGIGGNTKVCDSYEEAELACLEKLIEIVEQQKTE